MQHFADGRDWFFEKRMGLFVHWGLYAIPAWQEQIWWRKGLRRADYVPLAAQFNPVKFDPDAWLDAAESAGMQYICLTTKHHDGFCLWNTQFTDFNVMNTPYGRDTLAMLAEACHRRRFPLCLYYSCVDWHQPNYPNQDRHHETPGPEPGDQPDFDRYMVFLKNQVRELCTNYGEIHGFWWDMNVPKHRDPSINALIRELQPSAIINDRGYDDGDFGTPERGVPEGRRFSRPTEACQSLGMHSWGYKADEDFFSDRVILQSIAKTLAMGGNYLLNVGPRADGTIQEEFTSSLRRIGEWYARVREAFEGAEPASELTTNGSVLLTRKGNTLYVVFAQDPEGTGVVLNPLAVAPRKATLLNTGTPLEAAVDLAGRHHREGLYLRVRGIPVNALAGTVPVAKLEFDALP